MHFLEIFRKKTARSKQSSIGLKFAQVRSPCRKVRHTHKKNFFFLSFQQEKKSLPGQIVIIR
jgi:hypothetical protein